MGSQERGPRAPFPAYSSKPLAFRRKGNEGTAAAEMAQQRDLGTFPASGVAGIGDSSKSLLPSRGLASLTQGIVFPSLLPAALR